LPVLDLLAPLTVSFLPGVGAAGERVSFGRTFTGRLGFEDGQLLMNWAVRGLVMTGKE
jgi:hypothetical protein